MKKLFAFIVAIVYLTTTVGATIHLHYCMDKLVNWTLKDEGSKCKNCGMEKDGGCCKDEHKLVKNNSDQKATEAIQLQQVVINNSPAIVINSSEIFFVYLIEKKPTSHAPSINNGTDILIRHCVFRI